MFKLCIYVYIFMDVKINSYNKQHKDKIGLINTLLYNINY